MLGSKMQYREMGRPILLLLSVFVLVCGSIATRRMSAQNETGVAPNAFASPSPTPRTREELPQDSDEIVRVDTNLTNIFFTAADKNKRFVGDLKAEDIRVLENVLRPNKDEAAVVSFTGETTLEQGFSGNIDRLRRAIDKVEFIPPSGYIGGGVVVNGTPPISGTNQALAGSTAIWDAVWATSEELISTSAEHTRRAIILLTDGVDTSSRMKMHDAIERAQKADALIYAIGIGDRYTFNVNEGDLRKIAEKTGGRAYFPRHEQDLRDAFTQIQRDLREQYLVAYSPRNKARDGSYRRIEIQLVNPELKQQLKLNYRAGYFAKTTGAEPSTRKRGQ